MNEGLTTSSQKASLLGLRLQTGNLWQTEGWLTLRAADAQEALCEKQKKDVKAGLVQTVQNVVGASAKRAPSVGVPCMLLKFSLCYVPFFSESMWGSFARQVKWTTSTSSSSPCGSTVVAFISKVWIRCYIALATCFFPSLLARCTTSRSPSSRCGWDVAWQTVDFFLRIGTLPLRWTASTS